LIVFTFLENTFSIIIIIISTIIIIVSFVWGNRQSGYFYRFGQLILRQIDANDNTINEDAGRRDAN